MEDVDAALGSETTACPDVVNAVDAMGRTGNIILPRNSECDRIHQSSRAVLTVYCDGPCSSVNFS